MAIGTLNEVVRDFVQHLLETVSATVGSSITRGFTAEFFPNGAITIGQDLDLKRLIDRGKIKGMVSLIVGRLNHDFGFTFAEQILRRSFDSITRRYPVSESAIQILDFIPENYLEKERSRLLTKEELESRVLEKTAAVVARETDLETALSRLKENEERFRAMVHNSSDIIMIIDAKLRIQYVSPSVQIILGYGLDELTKENALSLIHNDDTPIFEGCINQILVARGICPPTVCRFRRVNGEWVPLEVVASNLLQNQSIKGIILNARDVSERMKSNARIRELNELRSKFIDIVSHQLRTPLTAIRWNLESMLTGEMGVLTPVQKEFLRITYEADVEIIRRIHDLLTAMDIEEGRAVISKGLSSIEGLLGSVMVKWKKQCALKQIDCQYVTPDAPLPALNIDAEKIRNALEKLMENSVMYTPEKGTIKVYIKQTGGQVRFEIRDNGIGIPPQEQPRIFSRFFRASNAAPMQPDASGLGLSIAKFFIEQHGGSIGFTSDEGKGSTFWFELPVPHNSSIA